MIEQDQEPNEVHNYVVDPSGKVELGLAHDPSVMPVWMAVAPLARRLARQFGVPVGFFGTGGSGVFTLVGMSVGGSPAFEVYDRYRAGRQSALVLASFTKRGPTLDADLRVIEHHAQFARECGLRWLVLENADPITLDLARGLGFRRGHDFSQLAVDGAVTMPFACEPDSWYLDLRVSFGDLDRESRRLVADQARPGRGDTAQTRKQRARMGGSRPRRSFAEGDESLRAALAAVSNGATVAPAGEMGGDTIAAAVATLMRGAARQSGAPGTEVDPRTRPVPSSADQVAEAGSGTVVSRRSWNSAGRVE